MFEETGVSSIKYICESKEWHYYYLPNYLSKKLWRGKFIGQKKKWFAFDFLGNEKEIKIKQENIKPEFCSWKWVSPNKVSDLIINFKRDIYKKVYASLRVFIFKIKKIISIFRIGFLKKVDFLFHYSNLVFKPFKKYLILLIFNFRIIRGNLFPYHLDI